MDLTQKLQNLDLLTELFGTNLRQYKGSDYDEANTRVDFIDKFFSLLDWDVQNNQGYSEVYREVVREDKVKIEGKQKAPDYSFRIGGTRKFFVEAKKPSVNIKDDLEPAYQVRRYGYTAKLPLSILTDFEEFAIYDTRIKPDKTDKSSVARVFYCTFAEYRANFEFIYNTFSKEAILKGSFDRYVEDNKNKQGTSEVDKELLKLVEGWRSDLAKNIAFRNPQIDIYQLNTAVQKIIDRIVFLRIAEDKEIEEYGTLQLLASTKAVYARLLGIFSAANDKYNSGLFLPEQWLSELTIDDKVLAQIIRSQYYPECPYEFSILPIEILGNIYEQFLGKTIRFRNVRGGHTVEIEDKPEVRKAGGVFYTPQYIVDYITKKCVGGKIANRTPAEISHLTICDPACGSGSFLVGAYQFLLNFHLDYYTKEANLKESLKKGFIYHVSDGYRLTITEKQRILVNNIFGVDIDSQAVEVTKLSLYLKLLEDEGKESQGQLFRHSDVKMLPTLDENIQSGNSLIATDFYADKDMSLFGVAEMRKVNCFDWRKRFKNVFAAGGFDCIIGNPPYGANFSQEEKKYLTESFKIVRGQPESYEYFLAVALSLSKPNGTFSYIVPTNFTESQRADLLRENLLVSGWIQVISNFRYRVWKDNASETLVIVYNKGVLTGSTFVSHPNTVSEFVNDEAGVQIAQSNWLTVDKKRFLLRTDHRIIQKIENKTVRLGTICDVSQGIIVYETREQSAQNLHISDSNPDGKWKKLLDTHSSLERYHLKWGSKYLNYGTWLWRKRDQRFFDSEKIVFVRLRNKSLTRKLVGCFDSDRFYFRDNFNCIVSRDKSYDLKYVLAIFNSTLMNYWYKSYFDNVNINPEQVNLIPVRETPIAEQSRIAGLVDEIAKIKVELHSGKSSAVSAVLQQKIEVIDNQIDQLVYKIYGFTKDEIEVVERSQ